MYFFFKCKISRIFLYFIEDKHDFVKSNCDEGNCANSTVTPFPLAPKCTPILFKQMTGKDKKQRSEAPALKIVWIGGGEGFKKKPRCFSRLS